MNTARPQHGSNFLLFLQYNLQFVTIGTISKIDERIYGLNKNGLKKPFSEGTLSVNQSN